MKKLTRRDLVGILIFGLLGLLLFVFYQSENRRIDAEGIYILGKLVDGDSAAGPVHRYKYRYTFGEKKFDGSFNTREPLAVSKDSLLFLKIVPTEPRISRQMSAIPVPDCLHAENMPKAGWKTLPARPCQ